MIPQEIVEFKKVPRFLEQRNLTKQYQKAKQLLLNKETTSIQFKLKKPKKNGIYQFRINKQYRAVGYFENEKLIITHIDNHQS